MLYRQTDAFLGAARQGLERDMLLSLLRHCVHVGAEIVIKRSRRLKHG